MPTKKREKPRRPSRQRRRNLQRSGAAAERANVLSSEVVFEGKLFRVLHDKIIEPGGQQNERDVIRHNGSVVILAIDNSKNRSATRGS